MTSFFNVQLQTLISLLDILSFAVGKNVIFLLIRPWLRCPILFATLVLFTFLRQLTDNCTFRDFDVVDISFATAGCFLRQMIS
jgi:hypothetical protein